MKIKFREVRLSQANKSRLDIIKNYFNFYNWCNPFTNSNNSFLILVEGIECDKDLTNAINEIKQFIISNKIKR